MDRRSIRLLLALLASLVAPWLATAVAGASTLATGPAISVTAASADLNGVVDPSSSNSSWFFQYGPGSTLASGARSTPAVAVSGPAAVSRLVSGLSSGVSFSFRIVLQHGSAPAKAGGRAVGRTMHFRTLGPTGFGRASLVRSIAVVARGGRATVKLRCVGAFGAPCVAHLSLTHIRRSGRTVTCASASVNERAPITWTASMHLSRVCRGILALATHRRLGTKLHAAFEGGQRELTRAVTLVR